MTQPESGSTQHHLSPSIWVRASLFGLGYLACAAAGNALTLHPGAFVAFWLPSGLFVATLLVHQVRHWPAFVLAAFLANTGFDHFNGQAIQTSLLFFCGNGLEALAGAWLVRRFVVDKPTLSTLREITGFIALSALFSTMLSASIGAWVVSSLLRAGTYWPTWLLWWSGDVVGILLVAPFILSWQSSLGALDRWRRREGLIEAAFFVLVVFLAALFVFDDTLHPNLPLKYTMVPLVVWGAFRFGLRGASLASLLVAAVAAWLTVHGRSEFSVSGAPIRLQAIALQLFLAVLAFCGLIPAALLAESRRTREKLLEERQFVNQVIRGAHEGIIVYGTDLRYQLWNPFMERLSGLAASHVQGKLPLEVFPFLRETPVMDRLERVLSGEPAGSIDFIFDVPSTGRTGWCSDISTPLRNAEGQIIGVIGIVSDISARKKAEEELRKSEQDLRKAQRFARVGSWTWDIKTNRLDWSDEMFRIFGIEKEGFSGSLEAVIAKAIHPDDREKVERSNRAVIEAGRPTPLEYRLIWPDQSVHVVWAEAGEMVLDATGKPATLSGTVQEITERKQAEEERRILETQLTRIQKLESLGSLAGGVAHDMNNVLGAIMALATVHQIKAPEGTALRKDMETIARACKRGGTLVKGLLGFARQELAEEKEVDLNSLVREEVALLERTTLNKVHLELDLDAGLPTLTGDPSALSHALMNLCVNSVDAMPEGGTLTLRTRNQPGGMVLLEVIDTGDGMAKEILDKAMDPFFTTKPQGQGTGLGLSIVYGTVKAHRGKIEIQSEPGKGTRIGLRFPARTPQPKDAGAAVEPTADRARRRLQVLLVDDDELIHNSVQPLLEFLGHAVIPAFCGAEALEKLEAGLRPDVVILDMNMPGLSGPETLIRLRGLRADVPVLLATGRADQAARNLVEAHAAVTLLSKPFSLDELETRLASIA